MCGLWRRVRFTETKKKEIFFPYFFLQNHEKKMKGKLLSEMSCNTYVSVSTFIKMYTGNLNIYQTLNTYER